MAIQELAKEIAKQPANESIANSSYPFFSKSLKRSGVKVKENRIRITTNTFGLALLNPTIPLSITPSRVIFQVNKIIGAVAVGICDQNIVAQHSYDGGGKYYVNLGTKDHGRYMMYNHGAVYSHSNPKEDGQWTGFKFKSGDVLSVEFDSNACTVSYSLSEKTWGLWKSTQRHVQSVQKQHLKLGPLHFCVWLSCGLMSGACDVSLIPM